MEVRTDRLYRVTRFLFVDRVRVGIHERDHNALHIQIQEFVHSTGDRIDIDGNKDFPVRPDAFLYFHTTVSGDQRFEGARQTVSVGPVASTELQNVPESLCGDQTTTSTFALEYGVGRDGRSVHDRLDGTEPHLRQSLNEGLCRIAGNRRDLVRLDVHCVRIDEDEVREGSANVYAYQLSHRWLPVIEIQYKRQTSFDIPKDFDTCRCDLL